VLDHEDLLQDFRVSAAATEIEGWPCDVWANRSAAPHKQPHLPLGHGAVYVFSLSEQYGSGCPAGAGRVLKVGRAGARSDPRFYSHHYNVSSRSTLAKSLLKYPVLWPWLGISTLGEADVKTWMMTNLDRTHFFVPDGHEEVLATFEVFVRARVGSVFEGS